MLSFFKKNKPENEKIVVPICGKAIQSSEIPDATFAEEMLGLGMAIIPSEGKVYAPVDGELVYVPKSKHALSISSTEGTEILIHVGLDTVSLNGAPFDIKVEQGSQIKKGDLLMEFDMQAIQDAGLSLVSPVVVCNSDDFSDVVRLTTSDVNVGDPVMEIVR